MCIFLFLLINLCLDNFIHLYNTFWLVSLCPLLSPTHTCQALLFPPNLFPILTTLDSVLCPTVCVWVCIWCLCMYVCKCVNVYSRMCMWRVVYICVSMYTCESTCMCVHVEARGQRQVFSIWLEWLASKLQIPVSFPSGAGIRDVCPILDSLHGCYRSRLQCSRTLSSTLANELFPSPIYLCFRQDHII